MVWSSKYPPQLTYIISHQAKSSTQLGAGCSRGLFSGGCVWPPLVNWKCGSEQPNVLTSKMVLPETLCDGLKDQVLDGDFTHKKSSKSLWINHTSEDSEASSEFWLSLLQFVSQCWWVCHLLSKIHSCYVSFWMHKCLQLIISFVLSFHPFIFQIQWNFFFLMHLYATCFIG